MGIVEDEVKKGKNIVGLTKAPDLHSVGEREPLKGFEKWGGLLGFSFP